MTALVYRQGKLEFCWLKGAADIEMYEVLDDGLIGNRLGFLTTDFDGQVPFEQPAFEEHCKRFLDQASDAEIRVEDE